MTARREDLTEKVRARITELEANIAEWEEKVKENSLELAEITRTLQSIEQTRQDNRPYPGQEMTPKQRKNIVKLAALKAAAEQKRSRFLGRNNEFQDSISNARSELQQLLS